MKCSPKKGSHTGTHPLLDDVRPGERQIPRNHAPGQAGLFFEINAS
jgi:hypothetical protein